MNCIEKNTIFTMFRPFMIEYAKKNYENVVKKMKTISEKEVNKKCRSVYCSTYDIHIKIDYTSLIEKYKAFQNLLKGKLVKRKCL